MKSEKIKGVEEAGKNNETQNKVSSVVKKTEEKIRSLLLETPGLYLFAGLDKLNVYFVNLSKKGDKVVLTISFVNTKYRYNICEGGVVKEIVLAQDSKNELGPRYNDAKILDVLNKDRKEGIFIFSLDKSFYYDEYDGPYTQKEYYIVYLKPSEDKIDVLKIADYGKFYKIGDALYFIGGNPSYLLDLRDFIKNGGGDNYKESIKIEKLEEAYKVKEGVVFLEKERKEDSVGNLVLLTSNGKKVIEQGVLADSVRERIGRGKVIIKYKKFFKGLRELRKPLNKEYEKVFDE